MKNLRIAFFPLFAFSALISITMMYNLLRHGFGHGMGSTIVYGCGLVALQLAGLVSVILNRHRIVMGVLTIITGVATFLSGFAAFAALGAPASRFLGILSLACMGISLLLCVGYVGAGTAFLCKRP